MTNDLQKKIFFCMFCLASVMQGMYSTYFVSILTTIERIYQIQSKTAGAILSATETGQILGSLIIAYYGGKGNKPKWIAACMTLTALAALISTSPHFLLKSNMDISSLPATTTTTLSPYTTTSDLSTSMKSSEQTQSFQQSYTSQESKLKLPTNDQLCVSRRNSTGPIAMNSTYSYINNYNNSNSNALPATQFDNQQQKRHSSISLGSTLVVFFICLLAIGFGSTAINTLGIPFIDDIVSREESPLYLGLTIGLRIFGPALGFLLGSFCIRLNSDLFATLVNSQPTGSLNTSESHMDNIYPGIDLSGKIGAWWLGPILISIPLLILALPMYYLSRVISSNDHGGSDLEGITYQAAEDHDIGGSRDFQTHVLTVCDLDVTSNQTCYSEVDSSSREVLQAVAKSKSNSQYCRYNFGKNLSLGQPMITREGILSHPSKLRHKSLTEPIGDPIDQDDDDLNADETDDWKANCLVVDQFGRLESTNFTNDEAKSLHRTSSESSSSVPLPSPTPTSSSSSNRKLSTMDLFGSISRLIKNRLLLLRMLSAILHILPIAGFYTFLPKYLSEQFRLEPSSAIAISGLAGISFVGIGAFGGGTIVRVLNVNSKIMTKWIAFSALFYAIGMLILMNLGCTENQTVYHGSPDFISTDCLTNCQCSNAIYSPVCANGTTYISPCLAGCRSYTISEDKIVFDECGCSATSLLPSSEGNSSSSLLPLASSAPTSEHINLNVATQGHCLLNCDKLIWYIVTFSIFTLIHASCEVGSMMFNLRCVKTQDRTLALGLITFSSSLLGTIPCSVIYGTMIDLTCVHWASLIGSETKGACQAYENTNFRYYLHGVTGLVMFLAFLVDCVVYRYSDEVDFYSNNSNSQLHRRRHNNRHLGHHHHHRVKNDSKQDITSVHKESIETI